jgi:hypothetical protein
MRFQLSAAAEMMRGLTDDKSLHSWLRKATATSVDFSKHLEGFTNNSTEH